MSSWELASAAQNLTLQLKVLVVGGALWVLHPLVAVEHGEVRSVLILLRGRPSTAVRSSASCNEGADGRVMHMVGDRRRGGRSWCVHCDREPLLGTM